MSRVVEDRTGDELNVKWTLVRELGRGGASVVYEAAHRNGRRAAVKLMSRRNLRRLPFLELAAHEAALTNAVQHGGVVDILDDDIAEDGSPYLVMELLEGETLDARRHRSGGRLTLEETVPIVEQVLDVLISAHDRGIVHRDIKPENVFITRDAHVKVLDFGLAGFWTSEANDDEDWFGTPGFMPPEQTRAEWGAVDPRSDLWALAASIYTVLTGRLVHAEQDTKGILDATTTTEPDLSALDDLPLEVVDVLGRALAMDRADRFPNARAFRAALRIAMKLARSSRAPASASWRRHDQRRLPECHSTTRVFVLRGCTADCIMCPVCPAEAKHRLSG